MNVHEEDPNSLEKDLFDAIRHAFSTVGKVDDSALISASVWTRLLLEARLKRQEGGQQP